MSPLTVNVSLHFVLNVNLPVRDLHFHWEILWEMRNQKQAWKLRVWNLGKISTHSVISLPTTAYNLQAAAFFLL